MTPPRWSWIPCALLAFACNASESTVTAPAAAPPPSAPEPTLLAPGVFALAGNDPGLPTSDLEVLRETIGDRRVVGLGESVHTSTGYYQMKARVFRYLVEVLGFRALAFETEWALARTATNYVASCKGSSREATKSLLFVWQDAAVKDLLSWMCGWNQTHPEDPLSFWGFDTQQPYGDVAELRAFFGAAAPADASDVLAGIASCNGGDSTTQAEYASSGDGKLVTASAPYPTERHATCVASLDALDAYLARREAALVQATSRERWSFAKIASRSLRAWENQAYAGTRQTDDMYAARDAGMADTLLALRELEFPNARVMIWAHNLHLAIDQFTTKPAFSTAPMMGTHLSERLGADYVPIALIGYDVKINWPGYPQAGLPSASTSLEVMLHGLGGEYAFVPLRGDDARYLADGQRVKMVEREQVPSEHFAGVIFLDQSPAMTYVK
jgi:erythromycin esterase